MSREKSIDALTVVLSSSYLLYLKTQNFHWNVTGPNFFSYHQAFEEQYTELAQAVDDIAERIRALGAVAPGSFEEFKQHSSLQESLGSNRPALEMVGILKEDHEWLVNYLKKQVLILMEEGDEDVADFLNSRLQVHEKTLWMLASCLTD